MFNKKHKMLIERRLSRLEKAIDEEIKLENLYEFEDDIEDDFDEFEDELEDDLEDDLEDELDDDEDDMYESRRRKLERRVRFLERKLADEGILDSIKNVANKISGKAADAKLSAKELVSKLKLELETMALGITSKLDDAVGAFDWGDPIIKSGSNGIVRCRIVGENGSLPHTKRTKDNVGIDLEVNTDGADKLKDCVVNYDVYINSKATTASAPDPISDSNKLLSLLKPNEWKKIAQSFKPVFNKYVEDNT